jgi:hypothetical protein
MTTFTGFDMLPSGTWDCGAGGGEWSSGGRGCGSIESCGCGGACGGCSGIGGCGGKPGTGEAPRLPDYDGEIWSSPVRATIDLASSSQATPCTPGFCYVGGVRRDGFLKPPNLVCSDPDCQECETCQTTTAEPVTPEPPGEPPVVTPVKECCIRLICRDVEKVPGPGVHCGIEKISCNGDRVVYELLIAPPKAKDVRQQGGSGSQIYAIRDPNYAAGTDTRYKVEFSVCYPCDDGGRDPIACDCVVDAVGRPNDVGAYPWRDSSNYNPGGVGDLPMKVMKVVADASVGRLFHPNSNSFAKYYMHRCTKKGHRPKMPKNAWGWGFDFGGNGPDHPPPWAGVSQATGERYD